jgi:hypothetical protein
MTEDNRSYAAFVTGQPVENNRGYAAPMTKKTAEATRRLFNELFGEDAEAIALELMQLPLGVADTPEGKLFEELARAERAVYEFECQQRARELEAEAMQAPVRAVAEPAPASLAGSATAAVPSNLRGPADRVATAPRNGGQTGVAAVLRAVSRMVEVWCGLLENWLSLEMAVPDEKLGGAIADSGAIAEPPHYFGFKLPTDRLVDALPERDAFVWLPGFLNVMGTQTADGGIRSLRVSAYDDSPSRDGSGALLVTVSDKMGCVKEFILTAKNRSASIETAGLKSSPSELAVSISGLYQDVAEDRHG